MALSGLYSFNTHLLCLFIDTTSNHLLHTYILIIFLSMLISVERIQYNHWLFIYLILFLKISTKIVRPTTNKKLQEQVMFIFTIFRFWYFTSFRFCCLSKWCEGDRLTNVRASLTHALTDQTQHIEIIFNCYLFSTCVGHMLRTP